MFICLYLKKKKEKRTRKLQKKPQASEKSSATYFWLAAHQLKNAASDVAKMNAWQTEGGGRKEGSKEGRKEGGKYQDNSGGRSNKCIEETSFQREPAAAEQQRGRVKNTIRRYGHDGTGGS